MQVQPAGSSTEALLPPVEQDRQDDMWLVHSPCCHDNGLPPKPCISIMSPWSTRAWEWNRQKRGRARERETGKKRWISKRETCSSNLHLENILVLIIENVYFLSSQSYSTIGSYCMVERCHTGIHFTSQTLLELKQNGHKTSYSAQKPHWITGLSSTMR